MTATSLQADLAELRAALLTSARALDGAARQVRDADAHDVVPGAAGEVLGDALAALARRLDASSVELADGAVAVSRQLPAEHHHGGDA